MEAIAQQWKVGDEAFPIDNSYSFCLEDGKEARLAGNQMGLAAKRVKIISEPFLMPTTSSVIHTKGINEFVFVECESKKYCVLNNFYAPENANP